MPTIPGFRPAEGSRIRLTRRQMVASEAKSVGDALAYTGSADTLSLATSGDVIVAVYMDADRAASETDTPYKTVMLTYPDVIWEAEVESGTALATMVDDEVDLNSADGLDVDTSDNDDFAITRYISATRVEGVFLRTQFTVAT